MKIEEAQAEAAAALSGVAFKVAILAIRRKTVEEVLAKRYERSAGKARVAGRDFVNMDKIQEKEAERKRSNNRACGVSREPGNGVPASTESRPRPRRLVRLRRVESFFLILRSE